MNHTTEAIGNTKSVDAEAKRLGITTFPSAKFEAEWRKLFIERMAGLGSGAFSERRDRLVARHRRWKAAKPFLGALGVLAIVEVAVLEWYTIEIGWNAVVVPLGLKPIAHLSHAFALWLFFNIVQKGFPTRKTMDEQQGYAKALKEANAKRYWWDRYSRSWEVIVTDVFACCLFLLVFKFVAWA